MLIMRSTQNKNINIWIHKRENTLKEWHKDQTKIHMFNNNKLLSLIPNKAEDMKVLTIDRSIKLYWVNKQEKRMLRKKKELKKTLNWLNSINNYCKASSSSRISLNPKLIIYWEIAKTLIKWLKLKKLKSLMLINSQLLLRAKIRRMGSFQTLAR